MKRLLKILGIILLSIIVLLGIGAYYINSKGIPSYENKAPELKIQMDSTSIAKGEKLATLICVHCHAGKNTRVLEGKKMEDIDASFGDVWIPNITQHAEKGIGKYTDGELVYLLRTGIKKDGQYAPPWMPKFPNLADEDLHDVIAFLRSDHPSLVPSEVVQPNCKPSFMVKALSNFVFKPFPYPDKEITLPSTTDRVSYGAYLANDVLHCYACHSADFTTNDDYTPGNSEGFYGGGNKMSDVEGNPILSTNITMSTKTGIGSWTEEDFVKAVKWGTRPDGSPILYPMNKYTLLDDDEVKAIWAYLQTVAIID